MAVHRSRTVACSHAKSGGWFTGAGPWLFTRWVGGVFERIAGSHAQGGGLEQHLSLVRNPLSSSAKAGSALLVLRAEVGFPAKCNLSSLHEGCIAHC